MVRYRRLGGTGLIISELCLGTMTFGNGEGRFKPIAGVDQAGAYALVERSLAAGANSSIPPIAIRAANPNRYWAVPRKRSASSAPTSSSQPRPAAMWEPGRMIAARPADSRVFNRATKPILRAELGGDDGVL